MAGWARELSPAQPAISRRRAVAPEDGRWKRPADLWRRAVGEPSLRAQPAAVALKTLASSSGTAVSSWS